jgi:Conjugative transposon protein TcpC
VSAISPNPRPQVTVVPRPLWRLRLARELSRWLLQALAVVGVLASARFAIAPPRAPTPKTSLPSTAPADLAAEGFAALFARRYLTWDSQDPEAHRSALAQFVGPGMDPDAGLQVPTAGEQQVQWTQVVQVRTLQAGERVYTVAAQTDTAGLLYLTVSVLREAGGELALGGYPAIVGAPATAPAEVAHGGRLREVEDPTLVTVVERALRNYLADSPSELAADLTSGARVALPSPSLALSLRGVTQLSWAPGGGAVLAEVLAQDRRGAQYTLAYELDVMPAQGRWEVSAIQTDPDS